MPSPRFFSSMNSSPQNSNKLLQQMLQAVSSHCFTTPPPFPPTALASPTSMPSPRFFSSMNSSLHKPLNPTALSFQHTLNPNARSFLPSPGNSSREEKEQTEKTSQILRPISKREENAKSASPSRVDGMPQTKEFQLEMKEKFAQ